jgi:hypothetical protein
MYKCLECRDSCQHPLQSARLHKGKKNPKQDNNIIYKTRHFHEEFFQAQSEMSLFLHDPLGIFVGQELRERERV